jgi:hypothetical protein
MNNVNSKTVGKTMDYYASEGLVLKGSVAGRTKRIVGEKKTELVTYKIFAGTNIYFVKDWAPKEYYPVGELVELPITIKSFQKDGRVMIDYTISGFSMSGEEF